MNQTGIKKGAMHSPGNDRQKKQTSYLFFILFATIVGVLLLALFNALWSESAFFQWLLVGSLALLFAGAIVARLVFHVHITTKQVVLWLTLMALAGTSFIGLTSKRGLKRADAAMIINSYAVSAQVLDRRTREIEQTIRQIRAQVGPYADMFLQMRGYAGQPREIATRQITQEKLLLSAADGMGIDTVSPDYIALRLRDSNFVINNLSQVIPPYLAQGAAGVDGERLNQYLKHQGISTADFEENLEEALRAHIAATIFPTALYTPQASIRRTELMANSTREFAVENFSLDKYVAKQKEQPVTEEALRSFFDEQNKAAKRYFTPEKRRGTVWTFAADNYNLPLTDVEVRRYFADHSKEFGNKQLAQVKGDIEKALIKEKFKKRFGADAQRIIALNDREPEAFAQFVEKRKGKKEELGWLSRASADKAQTKALFSIFKIGQKAPIATENNGYVVMLDEIQPSILPPLAEMRDRVLTDLRIERATKQLKQDLTTRGEQVKTKGVAALVSPQMVKVSAKEDWEKLSKKGLPTDRMQHMTHAGAIITDLQEDGQKGGNCLVLSSITPTNKATLDKPNFAAEFTSREISFFAPAFIASLNSSATIKKGGKQRVSGNFNDEE